MKNIVKTNKEGRMWIDTSDFLHQDKIKETIKKLLDSKIIKEIDESKRKKY